MTQDLNIPQNPNHMDVTTRDQEFTPSECDTTPQAEIVDDNFIAPVPSVHVDSAKPRGEITVVASAEQQMIQSIATMAADPSTDVDKIDRLFEIQIKMMDRQAKMDFDQALARVQADMPRITENGKIKNKNGQVTATYLKYEDIDREIRPRLQKEGFSLVHTRHEQGNKMIVTTTLKHNAGHEQSVDMPLPYDAPNAMKNAVQAAVSTYSYGKRVNVCSLLNIVAQGEDDDGQMAEANYITEDQAEEIKAKLAKLFDDGKNVDTRKFLNYIGADCVEKIPAVKYEDAMTLLLRKESDSV